jgi:large subunit ribosomal protein L23
MNALNVILGPIISEKSMSEASLGRYTFKVANDAGKYDIKKAVEEKFKVNVTKITTVLVKGRGKRQGTRRVDVVQTPYKKALVTVKEGQKIAIFDQGTAK